jgi:hypothetical protein
MATFRESETETIALIEWNRSCGRTVTRRTEQAMTEADACAAAHALIGDQQMCRDLLGIPDTRRCAYLLSLGYPADRPLSPVIEPKRRPLDEVHHKERW